MTIMERFFQFLNKPYNGRPILAVILVVSVMSAFAFWVWPTPYQEWTTRAGRHGSGPVVHHRVNRFNGAREFGFSGFFGTVNWNPENSSAGPNTRQK